MKHTTAMQEPMDDPSAEVRRWYRLLLGIDRDVDPEGVLVEALGLLLRQVRATAVYLQLRERGTVRYEQASGIPNDMVPDIRSMISTGSVAAAIAQGRVIETTCALSDARFQDVESVVRNQIQAAICVPILEHGPIGVFYLQGPAFDVRAKDWLLAFAEAIAPIARSLLVPSKRTLGRLMRDIKRRILIDTLNRNDWNADAASKVLGVDRTTIYRLRVREGIDKGR